MLWILARITFRSSKEKNVSPVPNSFSPTPYRLQPYKQLHIQQSVIWGLKRDPGRETAKQIIPRRQEKKLEIGLVDFPILF